MKAAVLHNYGEYPHFEEFPDPVPDEKEELIDVKAVTLENIHKMIASGEHFASSQFISEFPTILGFDGIGRRTDGKMVGFGGPRQPYGSMAEKTVVSKSNTVLIPEDIDAVTAATVPGSALTSLFPLKWGAKLVEGETVLINGATGVSGKLAVQVAKLLGAGRVVGTGRNPESMKKVKELGADAVIDLTQSEEEIRKAFQEEKKDGYDIIIDYVWGKPTELLLDALTPDRIDLSGKNTRLVQLGEKAGSEISLSASMLRTSGVEIFGGAKGMTLETKNEGTELVWQWLRENKLQMEIEKVALQDIEEIWQRTDFQGKRVVLVP